MPRLYPESIGLEVAIGYCCKYAGSTVLKALAITHLNQFLLR